MTGQKSHDGETCHGFTRSTLSNNTQGLSGFDLNVEVVHSLDDTDVGMEVRSKIFEFENGLAHVHLTSASWDQVRREVPRQQG